MVMVAQFCENTKIHLIEDYEMLNFKVCELQLNF